MPLHHEVAGEGPPVLLIHAGVADSRMWDPQWPALTAEHRVVRLDLRGFGRSPMADEPWDAAGEIAEVLDAAGIERADVVAASYGGLVALELATLHPDRVGRLVLLSPNLSELEATPDFQRFAEEEERLFEAGDLDAVTELNVRTWLGPEASDEARELVREMQRRAFEIQLAGPEIDPLEVEVDPAAIESETLIVTGDHDLDHFQNIGAHLEATMPNVRRVTLAWAGHLPSLERPEEMTALLLEALRPLPRRS